MAEKVRLRIIGLTYSQTQTGSYALVLAEENGKKRIPIMIGAFEAQSIALYLEELKPPRPLTHDLFRNFALAVGVELKEVFISKLEEGIFYAELSFYDGSNLITIDSRTSDAVALALRFQCPIFTTREIIEKAGIILDDLKEEEMKDIEEATQTEDKWAKHSDEELQQMLDDAVRLENYEQASDIRDEIKRRKEKS
ncbi:MAG: bifunctional nuclease family protein [Bacteroidales bacterium]|nr:bifunctional nuclease family protein [Bacteroidales bacterium]